MKRNKNFARLTIPKSKAQLEMIRLGQYLAGEAFVYSVIFN